MAKQPSSPTKQRPNVLDTFAGVVGMVGGLFSKRPDRVLDESDVSEPISYGWLKKRGRLKLWQKRWVCAVSDGAGQALLQYYGRKTDTRVKGCVKLTSMSTVSMSDQDGKPFGFKVVTPMAQEPVYFSAESDTLRVRWIQCILNKINRLRKEDVVKRGVLLKRSKQWAKPTPRNCILTNRSFYYPQQHSVVTALATTDKNEFKGIPLRQILWLKTDTETNSLTICRWTQRSSEFLAQSRKDLEAWLRALVQQVVASQPSPITPFDPALRGRLLLRVFSARNLWARGDMLCRDLLTSSMNQMLMLETQYRPFYTLSVGQVDSFQTINTSIITEPDINASMHMNQYFFVPNTRLGWCVIDVDNRRSGAQYLWVKVEFWAQGLTEKHPLGSLKVPLHFFIDSSNTKTDKWWPLGGVESGECHVLTRWDEASADESSADKSSASDPDSGRAKTYSLNTTAFLEALSDPTAKEDDQPALPPFHAGRQTPPPKYRSFDTSAPPYYSFDSTLPLTPPTSSPESDFHPSPPCSPIPHSPSPPPPPSSSPPSLLSNLSPTPLLASPRAMKAKGGKPPLPPPRHRYKKTPTNTPRPAAETVAATPTNTPRPAAEKMQTPSVSTVEALGTGATTEAARMREVFDHLGFRLKHTRYDVWASLETYHLCRSDRSSSLWEKHNVVQKIDAYLVRSGRCAAGTTEPICTRKGKKSKEDVGDLFWFFASGVPHELRAKVYMKLSGAEQLKAAATTSYWDLKLAVRDDADAVDAGVRYQVDVDMRRTFGGHRTAINQSPNLLESLRSLLLCHSLYNPVVGYCQGLNNVAGFLLLFLSEEDTFWILCAFCSRYFPGYYAPSMLGLMADLRSVEVMLGTEMPQLAKHIQQKEIMLEMVLMGPLLNCFVGSMPSRTLLRYLDMLILCGPEFHLVSVMSILQKRGDTLTRRNSTMEFSELMESACGTMLDGDVFAQDVGKLWRSSVCDTMVQIRKQSRQSVRGKMLFSTRLQDWVEERTQDTNYSMTLIRESISLFADFHLPNDVVDYYLVKRTTFSQILGSLGVRCRYADLVFIVFSDASMKDSSNDRHDQSGSKAVKQKKAAAAVQKEARRVGSHAGDDDESTGGGTVDIDDLKMDLKGFLAAMFCLLSCRLANQPLLRMRTYCKCLPAHRTRALLRILRTDKYFDTETAHPNPSPLTPVLLEQLTVPEPGGVAKGIRALKGPALRSWLTGTVSPASADAMLAEGVAGDDLMDFEPSDYELFSIGPEHREALTTKMAACIPLSHPINGFANSLQAEQLLRDRLMGIFSCLLARRVTSKKSDSSTGAETSCGGGEEGEVAKGNFPLPSKVQRKFSTAPQNMVWMHIPNHTSPFRKWRKVYFRTNMKAHTMHIFRDMGQKRLWFTMALRGATIETLESRRRSVSSRHCDWQPLFTVNGSQLYNFRILLHPSQHNQFPGVEVATTNSSTWEAMLSAVRTAPPLAPPRIAHPSSP